MDKPFQPNTKSDNFHQAFQLFHCTIIGTSRSVPFGLESPDVVFKFQNELVLQFTEQYIPCIKLNDNVAFQVFLGRMYIFN
jgi:hypothetical protein